MDTRTCPRSPCPDTAGALVSLWFNLLRDTAFLPLIFTITLPRDAMKIRSSHSYLHYSLLNFPSKTPRQNQRQPPINYLLQRCRDRLRNRRSSSSLNMGESCRQTPSSEFFTS